MYLSSPTGPQEGLLYTQYVMSNLKYKRRSGLTLLYAHGHDLPHEVPLYRNHMYSVFHPLDPSKER